MDKTVIMEVQLKTVDVPRIMLIRMTMMMANARCSYVWAFV